MLWWVFIVKGWLGQVLVITSNYGEQDEKCYHILPTMREATKL